MNKIGLVLLFFINILFSQKHSLPGNIEEFKEHANVIVLNENLLINIKSINAYQENYNLECLVLNETGFKQLTLEETYDKSKKINNIGVEIYNTKGVLFKKFSSNDFTDTSASDGVSIYSDNRVKSFQYVPTFYPFILKYNYQVNSKNTSFISSWVPIQNSNTAVLKSSYVVNNQSGLKLNFIEKNFDKFQVEKISNGYEMSNFKALKLEYLMDYDNEILKVNPYLEKINYEGFEFRCDSWKNFGIDYYANFLKDNIVLNDKTKLKIKEIVQPTDSKIDKIKKLYDYLQNSKRYVSIQVKEGGLCPMPIEDVEKYSYGDCKGLSNYMRALLNEVGIESYCAVLYGGTRKLIDEKDISFQGNHMILAIPFDNELMFVECTDLDAPLGYLGQFTSNRNAIVFKPNGAEIIETKKYDYLTNLEHNEITVLLNEDNSINATMNLQSFGINYDSAKKLANLNLDNLKNHYKEKYSHLNNLKIEKFKFNDDKQAQKFIETVEFTCSDYLSKDGENLIVTPNIFQRKSPVAKVRNRKFSFKINYGYSEKENIKIKIPVTYTIKNLPDNVNIKTKFGNYIINLKVVNDELIYEREFNFFDGNYMASEYEDFKQFTESISKLDNLKILLEKK